MTSPETREIATVERDPYVSQFTTVMSPQDETIRLKAGGRGVGLYDEIRRDPHAFAVLQKRYLEVSSREWFVTPASDRRVDVKAAEFVTRQFKAMAFDRMTLGLMSAVLKGYAVAEVMWTLRGGVWWLSTKAKKQRRFVFNKNAELRMLTRDEGGFEGIALPDRKFIVHRYSIDQDDDDPYGLGLGTVLFWPAWFKRQVLAHWLQSTERHASPTIKATYPGGYDKKRQDELLAAIRSMARDAGIVLPENVVVELLESARGGGGEIQEKLGRYLDELMSEAVLGETLSTNSGERGARSLGEIHNDVRIAIAKADADLVSMTLNKSAVPWIIDVNAVPIGDGYPTVWRDFAEAEDLDKRVQRDEAIYRMGYRPKDPGYINETYGGEWIEKPEPAPSVDGPAEEKPVDLMERVAALFAEPAANVTPGDPSAAIADQLEELAAPDVDAMVDRVRQALERSTSFDEFAEALLALSGEIDVSQLAGVMEDAMIVADLSGRAEVVDGR